MAEERQSAPQQDYSSKVVGWISDVIEEGEAFLRSQQGYSIFDQGIDAIMGELTPQGSAALSNLTLNITGKVALDLAASLTDIKPFWEYRTLNPKFQLQQVMAQKRATHWWHARHIDLKFNSVIKYGLPMGTGYAHHVYNEGTHDQDIIPEDPRDVLPIRPTDYISLQDAFGVCIRRERTVNYLRAKYPQFADKIHADKDGSFRGSPSSTRYQRVVQSLLGGSPFMQNLLGSLAGQVKARALNVPTCDVYTVYLDDQSRNESSQPVMMGLVDGKQTPWSYKVEKGQRLYPRKRCIVYTRSVREPLYDGPSIYWHGLFPVTKLTLDPWPWTWLGKPILKDVLPLQKSLDKLMRTVEDHNERVARPGIAADKNAVPRALMERLDTRRAGVKIRHNPIAGKGVELIHEPPLDPAIQVSIESYIKWIKELTGSFEMQQLMQLSQIPAAETVEKMLESYTPAIRLRSRVMEVFMNEFAMIVLSNFFQFDTQAQRLAILGPQGLTFEDADYDPGSLIPDYIHASDFDEYGNVTSDAKLRGPLPRAERATTFLRNFVYYITPGSLLAASNITKKLLYLQLARANWMDIWSLGEILEIPNIGMPPDGANTIPERLVAQQQMGLGMAVNPAGRKASGQEMPRQIIKES